MPIPSLFTHGNIGLPNERFYFICTDPSRNALGFQWIINGTLLENITLINLSKHYNPKTRTAELLFNLPLEHNLTTIQCIANFATENVSSESFTLLLQGQLKLYNLCYPCPHRLGGGFSQEPLKGPLLRLHTRS